MCTGWSAQPHVSQCATTRYDAMHALVMTVGESSFPLAYFDDPLSAKESLNNLDAGIQELHDEHFKVVLHTVFEGRRFSGTVADPCTAPPIPSGRTPDGRWPPDRQASCYWPVHKPLLDIGYWSADTNSLEQARIENMIGVVQRTGGIQPGKTPAGYDRLTDSSVFRDALALVERGGK